MRTTAASHRDIERLKHLVIEFATTVRAKDVELQEKHAELERLKSQLAQVCRLKLKQSNEGK